MKRETIYEIWRGKDHPWVAWVKPALFDKVAGNPYEVIDERHVYRAEAPPWAGIDTSWLPDGAAVIIDLPGKSAVSLALGLGQRGLRPVLSINACSESGELIPMGSVLDLLAAGARFASAFPTGPEVAPAFILDSRRSGDERAVRPGCFDNRWVVFGSDLPSVDHLRRVGISRVVLVQRGTEPLGDVEAVLRAYQAGGLELLLYDIAKPGSVTAMTVARRGWFSELTERIGRRLSHHRRWDGSFGHREPIPPEPSHG